MVVVLEEFGDLRYGRIWNSECQAENFEMLIFRLTFQIRAISFIFAWKIQKKHFLGDKNLKFQVKMVLDGAFQKFSDKFKYACQKWPTHPILNQKILQTNTQVECFTSKNCLLAMYFFILLFIFFKVGVLESIRSTAWMSCYIIKNYRG